MPATIFYDEDASLEPLRGKRIAVIGYGSQGRAHALNLADSGLEVVVGLRAGSPSRGHAENEGASVASVEEACTGADLIALMLPDQHQQVVFRDAILPTLSRGVCLLFAHGFNIHYGSIEPPADADVVMIGPKAPGPLLREEYIHGRGVPAVLAVSRDFTGTATDKALAYAKGLRATQAGVIETTFAEETETDLFGEQAVLAGGVSCLIQTGFETLVEAGYQEETAYFECLHEMKLVVDLIQKLGIAGMRAAISDTAKYGSLTRGSRVIGASVKREMEAVLADIRSGAFFEEWMEESRSGAPLLEAERRRDAAHPIEAVGGRLRAVQN